MKKTLQIGLLFALSILAFNFTVKPNGYAVGDTVKDFNLKNVDGKFLSLATAAGSKGAILVFTCNHCPFSVKYEDRILALDKKYASKGFPVIAINPNDVVKVPEDNFEAMKVRAKEKGFTFPYLLDDSQETAKAFGAERTPHVFIVKRMGTEFTLVYVGAIDNNANDAQATTEKYAESALDNLLTGTPVAKTKTKSIGCGIKWKNS